jgi:hypothetical protein
MTTMHKAVAASVVSAATFAYTTALQASEPTCQQFAEGCYGSGGTPYASGYCYDSGGLRWCEVWCEGTGWYGWCYTC